MKLKIHFKERSTDSIEIEIEGIGSEVAAENNFKRRVRSYFQPEWVVVFGKNGEGAAVPREDVKGISWE
jgi:hypothetical protein